MTGDWANFREGRTVGIRCVRGYKLNGQNETLCKNGQWTNDLGKCEGLQLKITLSFSSYNKLRFHEVKL